MPHPNIVQNESIEAVKSLIDGGEYSAAENMALTELLSHPNDLSILRLLAKCYKVQQKNSDYLEILKRISENSSDVLDREIFIDALLGQKQIEQAFQSKQAYMSDLNYKRALRALLSNANPLAQRSHQFYFATSLSYLKEALRKLANEIITVQEHLNRAMFFIEHLFDLSVFQQQVKNPLHRPSFIAYSGVKEAPFIDAQAIIENGQFQNIHATIKQSVLELLRNNSPQPYVKGGLSAPKGLEHLSANSDWSSLSIHEAGRTLVEEAKPLVKILYENFDLADCPPMAPEIMISILQPGTHITPHYGISNIKQTLHIPIVLPKGDIGIKVGGIQQTWPENSPLIFDDSFLHEAWNRSEEVRIVLILDIWHPSLSAEEKTFLNQGFPMISNWRKNVEL